MTRFGLVSIVLAAALSPTVSVMAQDGAPGRPPPPPTRGGGGDAGDGVRGPRVPGGATKGDGGFEGRRQERPGAPARGEEVQARLWFGAFESMSSELTPDQIRKNAAIKAEFQKVQEEWRTTNGTKMKELQKRLTESRKGGGTTDPSLMEEMKKLSDTRPKFEPFKKQSAELLTPEQLATHKESMAKLQKKMSEGREGVPDGKARERKRPGGGDGAAPPPGDAPGRGRGAPPPPAKDND